MSNVLDDFTSAIVESQMKFSQDLADALNFDYSGAIQKHANILGLPVDQLTETQKHQAILNYALARAEERAKQVSDIITAELKK